MEAVLLEKRRHGIRKRETYLAWYSSAAVEKVEYMMRMRGQKNDKSKQIQQKRKKKKRNYSEIESKTPYQKKSEMEGQAQGT